MIFVGNKLQEAGQDATISAKAGLADQSKALIFLHQTSDIKHQISNIKHQASNI